MAKFVYPYNDLVICKDSTDYLVLSSGVNVHTSLRDLRASYHVAFTLYVYIVLKKN